MNEILTRASSINRALDEVGDKWCLLIIQEVLWGINSFNEMLAATGVSRSVLTNRLDWLQSVGCLRKKPASDGAKRMVYHLTRKSVALYDSAMMAIAWERRFFSTPALDGITLIHRKCGEPFNPEMRCKQCDDEIVVDDVDYKPGPGAQLDLRKKKVRRRSSIDVMDAPTTRAIYRNLMHVIGDRWTANVAALAMHGFTRFEQFRQELPVATNVLSDRLRFLVNEGVFQQRPYRQRPVRYEYYLTEKGKALFPWFVTILQWGDKYCDPEKKGKPVRLTHKPCGRSLVGQVKCNSCGDVLKAHQVEFSLG